MKKNNQRKIGAFLSYISIILSTLVSLLYTPFLISKLGQSEFGLYSLVSSIIGYLTVLDLGFGNAIVVFTSKYRANSEYDKESKMHGMFLLLYSIIGFIVCIIGIILYLNVDLMFSNSMNSLELEKMKIMMLILVFNLAITFMFSIYSSIITAHEKFVFQKILAIANTLIKPLIMIPLLFLGYKSISLCIVITIVNCIVLFLNYFYCKLKLNVKIKYNGFDKKIFKAIFGYSFFIFLGTIVDKVNWSVDQFILGIYCGTTAVSIYSVSSQLNTLFLNLSTAISGVLLPKISQMIAKNVSSEVLTNEFIKVGRIQYYIIFFMASCLTIFGDKFIYLWVGPNFKESYYISLILIIPLCFPLIQNLGLSILQAMNKYRFKAVASVIMSGFNILISIFLTRIYGVIGAAIGTAISLIVCNIIVMNIYYYKVIKINVVQFWKEIFILTIRFIFPVLLILVIMNYINIYTWLSLICCGMSYTILYFLTVYKFCINDYERNVVNSILNKLHIRKAAK